MDRQDIVTKVVQTVAQVQEVSGRSSAGIGLSTRPVGGCEWLRQLERSGSDRHALGVLGG